MFLQCQRNCKKQQVQLLQVPKNEVQRLQDTPRCSQETPKVGPRGANFSPGSPKVSSRCVKVSPRGPKVSPVGLKRLQEAQKVSLRDLKISPRGSKMSSGSVQISFEASKKQKLNTKNPKSQNPCIPQNTNIIPIISYPASSIQSGAGGRGEALDIRTKSLPSLNKDVEFPISA